MNRIDVTLPRTQWQSIRDAADKASPASLYNDYPGLHQSYVQIFRAVEIGLQADSASEMVTIGLPPETLTSIFGLPEFDKLRDGMPSRNQWFEVSS